MNSLLAFMSALKDNINFVVLIFVLCGAVVFITITVSVNRTNRRKNHEEHMRLLDKQRLDQSRSIVPVTRVGD